MGGASTPRLAIMASLGLLLGTGVYLYAVRGNALLLDLAAGAGSLICF